MPKPAEPKISKPTPTTGEEAALDARFGKPDGGWRLVLYTVIFKADTPFGRLFDLTLIWTILASVGVVVLDSVQSIHARWGSVFYLLEWAFTIAFTLEYIARLACVRRPARYARSFYGWSMCSPCCRPIWPFWCRNSRR